MGYSRGTDTDQDLYDVELIASGKHLPQSMPELCLLKAVGGRG
jgi:hypothetical protein